MLILTRRVGETVMIGNDVTVTVLGVKGNQVRIGVNAPKDVAVHREEIYERIKREEEGEAPRPAPSIKIPTAPPEFRFRPPISFTFDGSARVSSGAPAMGLCALAGEVAEWSKARPC